MYVAITAFGPDCETILYMDVGRVHLYKSYNVVSFMIKLEIYFNRISKILLLGTIRF